MKVTTIIAVVSQLAAITWIVVSVTILVKRMRNISTKSTVSGRRPHSRYSRGMLRVKLLVSVAVICFTAVLFYLGARYGVRYRIPDMVMFFSPFIFVFVTFRLLCWECHECALRQQSRTHPTPKRPLKKSDSVLGVEGTTPKRDTLKV